MAYPVVNFQPVQTVLGSQPISETSTIQLHPLGTVIRARDVNYGEGDFIYLKGAASTAAGDVVCFNQAASTTTRGVTGGGASTGPCSVAMSANVADQFGWYQIKGSGPVNSGTVAANLPAYLTSTAGQIDDAVTSGGRIDGMTIKAVDSGGFATCQFDAPCVAGDESGSNSGDVTLGAFGSTPNANGASLSGQVLTLQPASSTLPGGISTGAQTLPGKKTFASGSLNAGVFESPTNGGSFVPNTNAGNFWYVTAGAGVAAFTVDAPTNGVTGQIITFVIRNNSGGALAVTWNAAFKMATWTDPATANVASISFLFNGGSAWYEISRSAATVPL